MMRTVRKLPVFVTHFPAQTEAGDEHQEGDHRYGSHENDPAICSEDCGGGTGGVGDVVDSDQTDGGHVEDHVEPEIPGDQEADAVVECQAGPFIEAAFEGHEAVQMGDDKCLRNEEQENGDKPENDVGGTGFYGGAKKIGNDDEEDRGQYEVEVT